MPEYLERAHADAVPEDESLVLAAAAPIETQLPLPSTGLYGTHTADRRYGIKQTIDALLEIGRTFSAKHSGLRIGIGDISKRGGGPLPGHASHRRGVDVDVRILRKDRAEAPTRYQDGSYSREFTQDLVNAFRHNPVFPVKVIFFNDPDVTGVQKWPNHDNHLHVRFNLA